MVRDRLLKSPASQFLMLVPLHSQLPAGEQRAAFSRAPLGLRKVRFLTFLKVQLWRRVLLFWLMI